MQPDQGRGEETLCANCSEPLTGRFCASCAQDSTMRRVSLPTLVLRAFAQIHDLEGPLIQTLIGLTLRPGVVVTEYVEGRRKSYVNPVKYALIFGALMVVLIKLDPFGRARYFPEIPEGAPRITAVMHEMMPTLVEYTQLFAMLSAPLLALLLWAFFPRTRRTFGEQCALVFFIFGHLYLLQTPALLLGAYGSQVWSLVLAFMQVCWLAWAGLRFYGGSRWFTVLRVFVAHVIFFVLIQAAVTTYVIVNYGMEVFEPTPGATS